MNRNLLYTAVTRARKCITIVGDENVFYQMVDNTMQQRRYSGLQRENKRGFAVVSKAPLVYRICNYSSSSSLLILVVVDPISYVEKYS